MADRISSLDSSYGVGDLSVYPVAKDSTDTLYDVKNNAETILKQSLTFLAKTVIVEDTSKFPSKGIIRIGPKPGSLGNYELIYYQSKTLNTFRELVRGFAGSERSVFSSGVSVIGPVAAEIHNAVKDAILNIETNLGTKDDPDAESLNGILKKQEIKFLNPRPVFRAFPIKGAPPLTVRFQSFSTGHLVRWFWDFGDGSTSTDPNPTHTYQADGKYTVTLNVMTSTGGQAVGIKSNYIVVDQEESLPFFYIMPLGGLSNQSAISQNLTLPLDEQVSPTIFELVDQTDGDITQRNWIISDTKKVTIDDPDIHTYKHIFEKPGTYQPALILIFADGTLKRLTLPDPVIVS